MSDDDKAISGGDLMAVLQQMDIPALNDAELFAEVWDEGQQDYVEVPVMSVSAAVGIGRPSRIVFHLA